MWILKTADFYVKGKFAWKGNTYIFDVFRNDPDKHQTDRNLNTMLLLQAR